MWSKKEPKLVRGLSTSEGRDRLRRVPPEGSAQLAHPAKGPTETKQDLTIQETSSSSASSSSDSDTDSDDEQKAKASMLQQEEVEEVLCKQLSTFAGILQTLGMDSLEATRAAQRMCSMKTFRARRPKAMELYGRRSLIDLANKRYQSLCVDGLCAMDLRTLKPTWTRLGF